MIYDASGGIKSAGIAGIAGTVKLLTGSIGRNDGSRETQSPEALDKNVITVLGRNTQKTLTLWMVHSLISDMQGQRMMAIREETDVPHPFTYRAHSGHTMIRHQPRAGSVCPS